MIRYYHSKYERHCKECASHLDGITGAPEEVGLFYEVNLKQAGQEHDFFYILQTPDPDPENARKNADRYLRKEIIAACKRKHRPLLGYLIGETYYAGVRMFGAGYFCEPGETLPIESLPDYGYTPQEIRDIRRILAGDF